MARDPKYAPAWGLLGLLVAGAIYVYLKRQPDGNETMRGLADQIHNVVSIVHPDGNWLMMHAKVDPSITLAEADDVVSEAFAKVLVERGSRRILGAHLVA